MRGAIVRATAIALALACVAPAAAGAQFGFGSPVSVSNTYVREGDGPVSATVVISRSGALLPSRTYRVTAVGGDANEQPDYEPYDRPVTLPAFAAGTQTVAVTLQIVGDLYPEQPETVFINIDSGHPFDQASGSVTILDTPDPPAPAGRTAATALRFPQLLLARAANGGLPNAPATDPVLSWDARTARFAAYTSAATNITAATNGRRNVFLVKRGGATGKFGTPWELGSTALASKGRGGQPANGDSWSPALGGWVKNDDARGPICLTFVSKPSNLVAGDGNGRSDLFVRRPRGGLRRIASPRGRAATESAVSGDCRVQGMVAGGALYVTRRGSKKLRKLAGGGVSSPRLSYNGIGVSFARGGRVYTQRIGGRARLIAGGTRPAPDGGSVGAHPQGAVRHVAYERAGAIYQTTVGTAEKRISIGSSPSLTAGGAQTLFASGPFLYLYAVSNNFGKQAPQGLCPPGQGYVTRTYTSARGNYVVFSCTGGAIYLSYIGPK